MAKFKKFINKFIDAVDNFLAYILTIIGIVVSNYIPLLKTSGIINIEADWWRLGISAIVALMIIGRQETLVADNDGSTDKAKAGRKKKFSLRMFNALSQGMAWQQLIDIASK
jgi:hypothetical protein